MDKRVFTMAILTIISAFILVLVIVYATNADKIKDIEIDQENNAQIGYSRGDKEGKKFILIMMVCVQRIGDQMELII